MHTATKDLRPDVLPNTETNREQCVPSAEHHDHGNEQEYNPKPSALCYCLRQTGRPKVAAPLPERDATHNHEQGTGHDVVEHVSPKRRRAAVYATYHITCCHNSSELPVGCSSVDCGLLLRRRRPITLTIHPDSGIDEGLGERMPIEIDDVDDSAGCVFDCLHNLKYGGRAARHRYGDSRSFAPEFGPQNRAQDVGGPNAERLPKLQQRLTNTRQQLGLLGSQPSSPVAYRPVADASIEGAAPGRMRAVH